MRKTLVACLAIVALFAIATSANAITCTIDQRPAATLLIPYFQATFNADGTIAGTGPSALDTLVTIVNASSAPMLAHVNVFSERSELVLDFNIALTGFDVQSFSVASILRGNLPQTGYVDSDGSGKFLDGCQRNGDASTFPNVSDGGFLRVVSPPGAPATGLDNTLATTLYPAGPFTSAFLFQVLDSLDATVDSNTCLGGVNGIIDATKPIRGYITIDHANYCNLSNPSDPAYWTNDAAGMENNLWGDYIYVSGAGIGTLGFAAVAIEADPSLADATGAPNSSTFPATNCANGVSNCIGRRTFYRRYVTTVDNGGVVGGALGPACHAGNDFATPGNTFDCGYGDQREPLGLKYAARWFDAAPSVTSSFDVWRASSVPSIVGGLQDLLGTYKSGVAQCITSEPTVTLTFFDEDENTVSQGVCPSPCSSPTFNFPLETQRTGIAQFSHPTAPAGWVSMEFFNNTGPANGVLDQAWVTYDFQGPVAFLSAGAPAAQLDPTNCQPLLVPVAPAAPGVVPTAPVIPLLVGTGA
jgi:hypothetical protein